MYKKILVPTDGSELSKQAVAKSVDFAKEINATLVFFHAKHSSYVVYYFPGVIFDAHTMQVYAQKINELTEAILNEAEEIASSKGVECIKISVESSEPYSAIIECADAQKCDLIFMASHGYGAFEGLLLGSQTNKVLVHSKISVLVCK